MFDPKAFDRRVVLITGAAHGIGRGIGVAFARCGAVIWGTDVLEHDLAVSVQQWRKLRTSTAQPQAEGRRVDVTDEAAVRALVQEIAGRQGRIDVLVHAAGGVLGQVWQPIEQTPVEDWRKIVAVNLEGAFNAVRGVAPIMKAQRYGRIVTISSGAGRSYSQTGIPAYAGAKAGLIGFTRQIARELGSFGITANSVAPGFVLSNPSSATQWEVMGEGKQRAFFEALAVKRLGTPDDIANAVLFFALEGTSYVTGQTISVDGGRWMLG